MKHAHGPPKPHPVAPNLPNTLAPVVRRLPIGIAQDDPAGLSLWRLWLPTNTGGSLTLSHGAGSQLWLHKPARNVLTSGPGEISYLVPDGTFGEFYVTASGSDAGTLIARFVQIGWSRESADKDAAPLLPWNFWPSKTGTYFAERAKTVVGQYATALGRSASVASKWEQENHQADDAEGWAGHCHNAAPASIVFEKPGAVTITGGLNFSANEKEMDFLATEYFGNYGQVETIWELAEPGKPAVPVGEPYLPAYFKPGLPKTKAALLEGLAGEFESKAAAKAADLMRKYKTEAAFSRAVDAMMGQAAAEFYSRLIVHLRRERDPLMANARSYGGTDGPEPIWNQIYFYYEAVYEETPDREDDRDVTITCSLYSNIDRFDAPPFPAKVSTKGVVTPGESGEASQLYWNGWRIIFTEGGKIDDTDRRCAWKHLKNGKGEELFPPTSLLRAMPFGFTRKRDEPNMLGNPIVGHELLKYLTVRKRYR